MPLELAHVAVVRAARSEIEERILSITHSTHHPSEEVKAEWLTEMREECRLLTEIETFIQGSLNAA